MEAGVVTDRRGPSIEVASGGFFHLLNPRVEEIRIDDIARALSHLCRYTGHCRTFYSVAQHSIHVSRLVPEEHALWGLLHDAAEAYIGDVSRPLKEALREMGSYGVSDYDWIEQRIQKTVAERFGLSYPMPACLKEADTLALSTERRDLMGSTVWPGLPKPHPDPIVPWGSTQTRWRFLVRFKELTR